MLTKILTAIAGLIIALMILRFFSERANRAQIMERVKARRPTPPPDPGPHVRPDVPLDSEPASKPTSKAASKANAVTTLEIDPDTGVYRPKG